ncbi:hypothetical protein [Shinella sp. BYT-45]|uniref:hypothetical protein n=1 Tax=Shinella sp. BYT-45 TaxID=3377377 RepID=UPI003981471F
MKIEFENLTAEIFDCMFDPVLRNADTHKDFNDHLDRETENPLRHITVEVNDAMLEAGIRAGNEISTYGQPELYDEDRIYRIYVAMERVRRMQAVIPPQRVERTAEE